MDNLLNSDLNTPEINYSDIGKEVKTNNALLNLPSDDIQPVKTPYQTPLSIDLKDYTRFISSDAFPKVGIDPSLTQQEMENQYDANQSNWEAFSNMMGKLSNKTADSFVNFFQADYLTNDALIKEVSKQLEEDQQYDLYHPNFDSRSDETRNSFLQWVPGFTGSADNYEQFLPNLGYTIGMAGAAAVQNIIFGALTGGLGDIATAASTAKKGKALWDLISGFKNIEVGYNALKTLNQGNKIVKATELGLAGFNMVAAFRSEAASEAAQTGQSTFQKLKDDYVSVHGYDPFGEDLQRIKDNAYDAAKTDFWMNAPILMTSNLIQFSRLLMPSAGKVVSEVMKDATKGYTLTGEIGKATFEAEQSFAKAFSAASKLDRVKLGASAAGSVLKAMKDPLAEGMEEALQRFSSTASQNYYVDKYYGRESIGKSVQEATSDMLSAEGMQEFIGGAIIGFGTSVVGKISNKSGLSDKYAKLTGGETAAQAEERKANYRTDLLDLVNKSGVDFAMKDNGFADAVRSIVTSKEMIDAKNMDETFDAINLKNHGGYKMIINAVKSGQLDWIKEQYKKIGETGDINKLAEIFNVNPDDINKNNIAELTNSIVRKIDQTASNYKKVTAEFEKAGIEKELIDNHNRLMVDALGNELELKKKYNIPVSEKMGAHWDKLDTTEKVNYNSYLQQIEQSQIDHYAYKEALDRAAVVYQTMVDDKDRSNSIVNTLNQNKPGLNYTESLSLLDKNTISKLRKQVQTSLGLATEKKDVSKFEKQLELLDKAKETIDAGMDHVALANIMKEYARVSNLGDASSADIDVFEKSTDLNKSLEDLAKLQKKNNQNLDIFNFLYNGKNFDAYRKTISEDLSSFFDQVAKWKEALDKDLESAKTETETKTETKAETKPEGEKKTEKEKTPSEETKTSTGKPISTKAHKNTEVFDEKLKDEAIENFIERHPIYKPEDIKFVVEKDKDGNKTVKVITNHVIVGGYKDLSNEKEFVTLVNKYNQDLKDEEERLADKEAIAKKVQDFVSEMQEVIKNLKEIRTKDRNRLIDEIIKFKQENRLARETPDAIIKLRKQIESIPELIENAGASQVSNDFLEETTELLEYKPSLRPYSPLKSIVQQAEVEGKNGYYEETGNLNKGFEEGGYLDFVQGSLDNEEFGDAMRNSVYELRVVHDSEDYDYERSEEFKKQMAEGTQKFGNIIVVTDSNGNPIRFDDNYNPVSTGGRIIVYKFSVDKFNVGDAIEVLQNITKGQFSYEQARQSVLTELGQLQAIDDFLDNNPEEKVAVDFFKVSKGVVLGSSKLSSIKDFFGDKPFDLKIVKSEDAKGPQLVSFMNGHAYNGSLVAVFDGEFIQVYTNRISDQLATEINTLLNHDYVKEDGTVDEQIEQVKEYLDSLIYTKEGGRRFTISGSKIILTDGKTVMEQLPTEQKLRPVLNVFSKYLQQDSLKPKFKIVDNVMSLDTTKDGEVQFSSVSVKQYKKFLTENSYLRGTLLNGKIKLVNKYIQFNVPQESLDLIGLGNKEEIITPKEVIVSTTKTGPTKNDVLDLQALVEAETGFRIFTYSFEPQLRSELKNKYPELYKELYDLHLDMANQMINAISDKQEIKKELLAGTPLQKAKNANSLIEILDSLPEVKKVYNELGSRFYQVAEKYASVSTETKTGTTTKTQPTVKPVSDIEVKKADIENAYSYITTRKYEGDRKEQVNKVGEDLAKRFVATLKEKGLVKEGFRTAERTDGSVEKVKVNTDTEGNNLGNDWSTAGKFKDQFRKFIDAELTVLEVKQTTPAPLNKLTELSNTLNNLYEKKEQLTYEIESYQDSPSLEQIIVENLPAISKESAERETGGQVGRGKDINPALIAKKADEQISVEAAAESVLEQIAQYYGDRYDVQDVRSAIIDILRSGKTKNQYLKELDKTKDLRDIDKQIKEVQKQYDELLKNDFNGVNPFTVSNDIVIDDNSKEKDPVKNTIVDSIMDAADLAKLFGDNNVGVNNDEEDPFRKKSYKGEIALDLMDKEEWDFLTKIVGKEKIVNLFNIANSNAWGKWTTAGVILWSNPKKGTGYHESWHHFSQLYLTKKEKIALYNEVRNKVPGLSDASDLQVEEYLADDFMNFMLSGGKSELLSSTPVKKNIFQKIWDVLKALFGTPNVDIEQLYNDLRIGNLYNYTPSVDNVMWGKLERAIYKEGSEIIPMERVEKYVRAADVYIGDVLTEKLTNLPENLKSLEGTTLLNQATYYEWMENPEKLNYLYNRLRKQMLDKYQNDVYLGTVKEDMEKIIFDNDVWNKFISEHQELSNIGISQDVDVETDEEISKDAVFSDKIYELPSNTIDLINLLPKKIEDMLRLIPEMNYNYATGKAVVALDDEGLPRLAITEDLRKRLIIELEGMLKVDKMIEKLSDPKILAKLPEAAKILEFIPSKEDVELEKSNDRKFEKISIRQSFLQAFTNPYIRSVMIYVDESGKVSVQELVTKGDTAIKKLFIDTFNNMADTSFGITEGIVKTDADGLNYISRDINDYQFDFSKKDNVLKFLSLLGVDFDPSLFQNDKIYTEFKNKITNQDLERLYKALVIRSMYGLSAYTRNPIDTLSKDIFHDVTDRDGNPVILESGKQKKIRLRSEYSVIKELVEFSNKYVRAIPSLMYINAKGQAEYAIQRHNGFTQRLSVINSVDSYKELIETPGFENYNMSDNYHVMGAKWMDLLFDFSTPEGKRRIDVKTGLPVRLDIVNYNAFQSAKTLNNFGEEINPVKASTADLTKSDRFFMDVYTFITNGIVPTIRTSDAKSFYSIFPSTYNPDSEIMTNLAIPLSEFASMKNVFASDKFLNIAKEYLKAELYKIKNKKEIFRDSLFEKKVAQFTLFADILSKDTKDNLINDLEGKEKSTLRQIGKVLGTIKSKELTLDEIIDKNIENIKADVNAYFSGEVEEFSTRFTQYGLDLKSFPAEISKNEELEEKIKTLTRERNRAKDAAAREDEAKIIQEYNEKIKQAKAEAKLGESKMIEKLGQAFVANYFIQAVEFLKFFESDLGYYSAYFKRSKGNGSDGALGIYDDTIVNFLANTPSMASVLGVTMTENDYKENRTIVWENDKKASVLNDTSNLTETLGGIATTKMVHDYVISKLLESGRDLSKVTTEELNDLISNATTTLKDYTETDGADGQAWCTFDFYRFALNLFGNWSKQQEDGYQAQVLKFGLHNKKYTDEQIELVQNKIKELEKKSKGVTYPPLKLNNRTVVNNSAYDPKFDKFSIAPMLFESIVGTPLEKRNEEMLMNKINYGTFQSGTKLSHPNLFNFFTDEIEPKENYVISTNPQFLKEQIKTNPSVKEQVTISTQSRVLIFADSFENELPVDFKGNIEAWDNLSEKERIKVSPIYRIYKTYLKNINDRLDYNRQEFYNEIGVTGNDKYIEFTDQKKLIEVIQKEIKERGLNKNVEEYIVYDPISKKNKLPLDYAPNRTGIGDIILGLVFKRIVKEKATGSQLIQVAGAGTTSTYRKGTEKDILIYGTNGLNFYYLAKDKNGIYRTVPMGVKVALNGSFKNILNIAHPEDGKPIRTRERLNEIIAPDPDKKVSFVNWIKDHREALTITGVRIPVGDTNFHDIMEVKEFLPEEAGDVIILPHEVTTKSGTDFDFDKMTIYKPTINSKGELVAFYDGEENVAKAKERIKEINNRISDIRKTQSEQVQSIVENFQSVEGLSKAKFATYKKVNELNKQIDDLNKKANALESEIQESVDKIGFIDSANYTEYEGLISKRDKLSDDRNQLLSSMEDMKIISSEFFNASKELKDLKNEKQDIYLTLNKNNHLTNELIRIYRTILTDPKKFYKLITPSKNPDFKEASIYVGDKVKRYSKDYNNTAVTSYFSSLDKGLQLLSTKGLLGIFAKLNKMGPLLQKAGFGLNPSYSVEVNKKKFNIEIKTPLMTVEQEKVSRKDGYISFGLRNTLSKKNLQDMKSQGIVSTVDIGSDSTFARFGANSENVGVLTLLLNMGIDPKVIGEFINQPVLIKMYDFIDKNYKSDSAMDNTYNLVLNYLKNTEEGIDFETNSETINQRMDRFKEGELTNMLMDSNDPDAFLLSEDRAFIKRQLEVLAHYESLKKIGDAYLQFQLNFSWDTSKNDSVIMAEQNDQAINEIMQSKYFRKQGLVNLRDNSITSGFRNNFIAKKLFTKLFPIASDKVFVKLLTENFPKTSRKMAARKVLVNDFVEAIIKTFGTYKGENLYDYSESLLMGESSLVNRFKKLKQSHPELSKDFSLVKRLFPNIDTNKQDPKTHNFEVYRVMDNKTSDQNNYIDQFRKLMNYPDAEVRKFFKDLSILSFHQSGFNKSYLSFFDIVPIDELLPSFMIANKGFESLSEENKISFIYDFLKIARLENPRYYKVKEEDEDIVNRYSERRKRYRFDADVYTSKQKVKSTAPASQSSQAEVVETSLETPEMENQLQLYPATTYSDLTLKGMNKEIVLANFAKKYFEGSEEKALSYINTSLASGKASQKEIIKKLKNCYK